MDICSTLYYERKKKKMYYKRYKEWGYVYVEGEM